MTGAVKQLIIANRAFDSNGFPSVGATASLYLSGTMTPALFYSDSGLTTSIGSTITANAAGRFYPIPYQDSTVAFRLIIKDNTGATLDDIDPFYFGVQPGPTGPAGDVAHVLSRTELAAIAGQSSLAVRYLAESGREGTFVWTASNLSSNVSADPNQGIYVAPSSDQTGASGAWVRKFSGRAESTWWGVSTSNTASANSSAFAAALATLKALAVSGVGYNQASIGLHTPAGVYQFASAISPTHALEISGDYQGNASAGTVFEWASASTHGIYIAGQTSPGVGQYQGLGVTIKGLYLKGGFTSAEADYHAVYFLSKCQIINCFADSWPGEAFRGFGNSAADSNINGTFFQNLGAQFCRWTVWVEGADSNACVGYNITGIVNRRGLINDRSFLGNSWYGGSVESCGNQAGFLSRCTVSGHVYVVAYGQEAWCSTNAPTGAATSNQGWLYVADGSASSTQPAWTTGQTWYFSAAFCSEPDNDNMVSLFSGIYIETNCNPVILSRHSRYDPAFWSNGTPVWRYDGLKHGGFWYAESTYAHFNANVEIGGNLVVDGTETDIGPVSGATSDLTVNFHNTNFYNIFNFYSSGVQQATLTIGNNTWFQKANEHYIQLNAGTIIGIWDPTGLNLGADCVLKVNNTQVITARQTGWAADTGTASRAAHVTYAAGTALTYSATYVQSEQTAMATRMAAVEAVLQAISQSQKALKDDLIAHGLIGA